MVTVYSVTFSDSGWASLYIRDGGLKGVVTVDEEKHEEFVQKLWDSHGDCAVAQEFIDELGVSLVRKPQIGSASHALRFLLDEYNDASIDDYMYVEYEEMDTEFFERCGLSQKEFEKQISDDIRRFALQNVLRWGGQFDDCLLVVSPYLRDMFAIAS